MDDQKCVICPNCLFEVELWFMEVHIPQCLALSRAAKAELENYFPSMN